ncbi:MAG TPA: TonB-dependent receptor [Thermodesulfovibrionales bacterium]|nr:TonB-dependent receptor [Thermodesulfovibrionales bacterium]
MSFFFVSFAFAGGIQTLDVVEVTDSTENLVGTADSANEGTVPREQIEARPVYRIGELMEVTPGLIVSQHSGEAKANQYYLRGMNLDHGTDLRITVDGMVVNERTHGHGQGYADLNFMIPELISSLQYRKGPYYAAYGDFASAGAVDINYVNSLPKGIASGTVGQDNYQRALLADAFKVGPGNLLFALEAVHSDGPWDNHEDLRKYNGVLRYSVRDEQNGFNITAMAYNGKDNATNQVAERAVGEGLISRFGTLNPTDYVDATRYSLSGAWQRTVGNSITKVNAYTIVNHLALFSDFTYFLNDPVNGDQFEQSDRRVTNAVNASQTWLSTWAGRQMENTIGLQLQNDNIFVGLDNTKDRQVLSVVRFDHVVENSAGLYFENSLQWFEKFRTVAGIRGDFYHFKVASDNPANSGTKNDSIASPKLNMIFGPWVKTEFFINLGEGFHSNDARGTTITVVPGTGVDANLPAQKVTPLVRSKGYETGARTAIIPGLQSSLTFFVLKFDSELVFAGDAGTTEAGRPSRRRGFEFANYYKPTPWLTIDADFAYTWARFTEPDPDPSVHGDHIPGAPEGVGSFSATVDNLGPWFGSLQLRYLGPRPLIEDNSVRSGSSTTLNGRIGYKFTKNLMAYLEGFNILDAKVSNIDYYYTSRLPGEPAEGVADIHFKPMEPRTFRISVIYNF